MEPRKELSAGNVGYIISGIKTSKEVRVGDTITHVQRPPLSPKGRAAQPVANHSHRLYAVYPL